jgi:hypothetical protein
MPEAAAACNMAGDWAPASVNQPLKGGAHVLSSSPAKAGEPGPPCRLDRLLRTGSRVSRRALARDDQVSASSRVGKGASAPCPPGIECHESRCRWWARGFAAQPTLQIGKAPKTRMAGTSPATTSQGDRRRCCAASARGQDHDHLAAFEARLRLDLGDRPGIGLHPVQELEAKLLVRHFAAAEA